MNTQASILRQAGLNALKAGRLQEAIAALHQSVGADPECFETWSFLGAAYSRQGDFDTARRAFGRAVQIDPRSPKARFNLGISHQMAGDEEAARCCFETALQLDPDYTHAREALGKLPPRAVSMADLAAPGGAVRLPGAHAETPGEAEAQAEHHALTPEEIARLAMPQGHLHMMGAQSGEEDKPDKAA
jgi:tetratricopeptide (TPR) repeat protein